MPRKKRAGAYHHGDLRSALLAAAWTMVSRRGVDGLSLRAVADALGVSHAAPAHHFRDKAALLDALRAEAWGRFAEVLEAAGRTPQGLRAMGLAYVEFALQHPRQVQLMFRAGAEAPSEVVRQQAIRSWFALESAVAAYVGPGGTDPGALTARVVACWAQVHGLAMLWTEVELPPHVTADDGGAALRARAVDLILAGLRQTG
jgi:AcrR family transcriptional regulator